MYRGSWCGNTNGLTLPCCHLLISLTLNRIAGRHEGAAGSRFGTWRAAAAPADRVYADDQFHFLRRICGIVAVIAFAAAAPGFATRPSLISMITTVSFVGCIAVGTTLITIGGDIMSLSLAATLAVSTIIFTASFNASGLYAAIPITLASAALVSGFQGLLIGYSVQTQSLSQLRPAHDRRR